MKKILSFIMAALVSLPMFAAKVAAPVLKIDETGSLVVANRSGKTVYMYSVTNQGTPSQPETVLPEEGVKLLASGTYNIIVTAQTKKGKLLGKTNACYHVYTVPKSVTSFTLPAGGSDDKVFEPFTITNAGDVDLVIARGTKGQFWKFDKKTAGGDVQKAISIGVDTRYPSRVSFYIKEKSGMTFQDAVKKARMKKARTMLKETNQTVESIAAYVGYENVEHFNRLFKKAYEMKPVQFRRKYQ